MSYYKALFSGAKLAYSEFTVKRDRDVAYLMELKTENILFSHYAEAGLSGWLNYTPKAHGGWDSPTSQIRGTFAGHWLSAAARAYHETGDMQLKAKADFIVSEIARCQEHNGGGWAFPIPEKYLYFLRDGKDFWAPIYVCHKNIMGLLDMYSFAGSALALEIVKHAAEWFYKFTKDISRETMDDMMDRQETGGIMEAWADLYEITGDPKHLELMRWYERPRLTGPVLKGEDILTNVHANTTIPEIHGCARAYEVTGEERFRKIAQQYWDLAVTRRGAFATGGQTCGEIWTPMQVQSTRLGESNQEHCVVYNMIRLADYLFRWTGDVKYADYIEQNIHNGLLAQAFWHSGTRDTFREPFEPEEGIVAYYLPLSPGAHKKWGRKTEDFWCCHCTAVQANVKYREYIYYGGVNAKSKEKELVVAQYIPSDFQWEADWGTIHISQRESDLSRPALKLGGEEYRLDTRPEFWSYRFEIKASKQRFTLKLRTPWWLKGQMSCWVNGEKLSACEENGYISVNREWGEDIVEVMMPKGITCLPLADKPDTVAFLDGPVVLAGLTDTQKSLKGDISRPEEIVKMQDEREWGSWMDVYRTVGQDEDIKLIPLKQVGKENYTVYFPVYK